MDTARKVLVLQHQDDDPPGNLASWLDAQEIDWQLIDLSVDQLPPPARRRALVVLGSRESVLHPVAPWAQPEREFVQAEIGLGTPVLGICYGAQLLAQVLGGQVHRSSEPERGWTEIAPKAIKAPLEEAVAGCWFEWHEDAITLPPQARLLAQNRHVQAFSHGRHLGVQFHPEITSEQISAWMASEQRQRKLEEAGDQPEDLLQMTAAQHLNAERSAARLYETFLNAADS
ncbi:type 1 glutamine amidotransferase [Streptomyces umbrinus]|uniref:type 1 glutamine amidotransferase n=1 Tax=Streptomyces umbrinus TaxID=67370 RepID=UPI0033F92199